MSHQQNAIDDSHQAGVSLDLGIQGYSSDLCRQKKKKMMTGYSPECFQWLATLLPPGINGYELLKTVVCVKGTWSTVLQVDDRAVLLS